ncbi:MAG: hypothetical protein ACJAX3_002408 [Patiriisocius sp.]|jgi:hypothetical protein
MNSFSGSGFLITIYIANSCTQWHPKSFFNFLKFNNMVKVTGFQKRKSNEGNIYYALELQSDELEFVVSKNTGRHYATVRKCFMSSTFNQDICEMMIGKSMPGTILKVECEPYSFVIEESGEEITRHHRYEYLPVETQDTEQVIMGSREAVLS